MKGPGTSSVFPERRALSRAPFTRAPPAQAPKGQELGAAEGKTRANRRAPLPGPRPSGRGTPCIPWALPNSPRPPTLLNSRPPLVSSRPEPWTGLSTPKKELQRLAYHGLPRLPLATAVGVDRALVLRTVLQPRMQGLHTGPTYARRGGPRRTQKGICMAQRSHLAPRGCAEPGDRCRPRIRAQETDNVDRARETESSVGSLLRDKEMAARLQIGAG